MRGRNFNRDIAESMDFVERKAFAFNCISIEKKGKSTEKKSA